MSKSKLERRKLTGTIKEIGTFLMVVSIVYIFLTFPLIFLSLWVLDKNYELGCRVTEWVLLYFEWGMPLLLVLLAIWFVLLGILGYKQKINLEDI